MATIRRAGFGTVFELEDSKVGIGTDAATHTLQALGNIRSEAATDIGISSLSTYQGFTDKEARFTTGQINNQSQSGATSGEIVIDGDVTVSSATTFTSGPQHLTVTDTFTLPSGDTNSRALKPTAGSLRFNQDFATLEFYTGNNWATVNTFTEMQNSPGNRGRGLFAGGESPVVGIIDLINIHSQGNATNFGNLSVSRRLLQGFSSAIRGLWGGGSTPSNSDVIDYVTIASEGDAIDFGNLTASTDQTAALSSSTRGLVGGGEAPSNVNTISFVEINTLGNSLDFGDLTETKRGHSGMASPTRGLFCGGNTPSSSSVIDMITIASKGNAVKFGDTITKQAGSESSSSNVTRGIIFGDNKISFVTLASEGNATLFGELPSRIARSMAVASQTRAVIAFGNLSATDTNVNTIQFVTISTSGSSADFGDLATFRKSTGGCSDSHGGLGGF